MSITLKYILIGLFLTGLLWIFWFRTTHAYTNRLDMHFIRVPKGQFTMGNPYGNSPLRDADPVPVRLTQDFFLQSTEVTQQQWMAVMGSNPSHDPQGGDLPVENVSYNDVLQFIEVLNAQGDGKYRLPTEAEWEYAARAGSSQTYFFGEDAHYLEVYAWYKQNAEGKSHPVASKQPNPWGFYDMYGNVAEWLQDWYAEYPVPEKQELLHDPRGGIDGLNRVIRGGNWYFGPQFCQSGHRHSAEPILRNRGIGFRLVWSAN